MIEIYKKLPKTNCGKCGVSTCMAFAQKVKKAEASFSECPFVKDISHKEPDTSRANSFSNYEQVSDNLEKDAAAVDFREASNAIGGEYISDGNRETIIIKMLNTTYELRKEGVFQGNVYCKDSWIKIIICDYVRRQGKSPPAGEWITLGHFPNTASHVKAFQKSAEKKIAEAFQEDLEGLKRNCARLGGVEVEGKSKPDYFCRIPLLPRVPLYLSFWSADEEFDAECKLLFDCNAEDHIDIEYLATLLELFVKELVQEQE